MKKVAQLLLPLANAVLLLAIVVGLPFAWILRDGLGSDSTATTGLAAVSRTLATFLLGPVILLMTAVVLLLRSRLPSKSAERNPMAIPAAIFLVLLAFSYGLSTWAAFGVGLYSVVLGPMLAVSNPRLRHRATVLTTMVLPLVALLLYYSLAIHMHQSLGGWPDQIGMDGFSDNLSIHADVAYFAFGSILLACLFALPVAALLCAAVPQLRVGLPYLAVYAISCAVAFTATQLAPDAFLYWWWD